MCFFGLIHEGHFLGQKKILSDLSAKLRFIH